MLAAGSTFGRYRIERELGAGGMGHVYEAEDTLLRRRVALKVVRSADDGDEGRVREGSARLLREARAAAALRHPNAVAVFDVGETDGVAFIAMELVSGRTLSRYVGDPSVGRAQKLAWLLGTARALAAAHRASIVHRDVKPENVMVTEDGSVKVLDFGIAKRSASDVIVRDVDGPASFRTKEGVVTGTPRYMAPEQLTGATIDARADQFAWGIVAYELLSGIHPQTTTGTAERWGAPAKPLAKIAPDVGEAISEIVMRALERWPEHRWPSMDEVVRTLAPHAGAVSELAPPPERDAPPAEEATIQLDDHGRPLTALGGVDPPLASCSTDSARARARTMRALVADPGRPTRRRMIPLFAGFGLMAVGLGDMVVSAVVLDAPSLPEPGKWIMRLGWALLFVAPLFDLGRRARTATVQTTEGAVAIRGARGMSQTLEAAKVAGASLAPLDGGRRFGVLLMPKRVGALPIAISTEHEDEAQAILLALGITHARAVSGTIAWSVGRGSLDVVRLVLAIAWRASMLATWIDVGIVSAIAFTTTLLAGLGAAALAFVPSTGPHIELTADELRVIGADARSVFALRDLVEASATADAIVLRTRGGQSVTGSGDTIVVKARTPRLSKRGLSSEERAHLVAHVNAAAARARAAWT